MNTPQAQIKVNLPLPLKEFLESRAQKFGLPVATYLKHLILKDIKEGEYPTFEASDRTIKTYREAMKNKDKAITVTNIDEFFKSL